MLTEDKIILLPDFIANQIAAGEVVQRPESVVKELVENSLDSDATEIAIIIQDAGKQLISVLDNGVGMSRNDLELSIKRHATSKIKTQEDLERISTFGFRGEALASITSVANVEIRTRLQSDAHGWRLINEPMKDPIIEPFNQEIGTQVFVRNLFFNVPARRKFLKSKLTEIRYISDTLIRFALANPDRRFTYYDEDTLVFDVHPSTLLERIAALLGSNAKDGFLPIEYKNELMLINGYIGLPQFARPSNSGQYLFVNRRPVESRNLSFAIYSAFEHLLEKNYKPVYVINLTIDPEKIDVNIHPQKNEVKFDNENYVYNTLRKAVAITLESNNLTTNINIENGEITNPYVTMKDKSTPNPDFIVVNQVTGEIVQSPNPANKTSDANNFFQSQYRKEGNYQQLSKGTLDLLFHRNEQQISSEPNMPTLAFSRPAGVVISELPNAAFWQLLNKYIFVQTSRGVLIVDQHNAHERVIYEKTIERFNKLYANPQELLFPVDVRFSVSQIAIIEEIKEDLKTLGFKFEKIESDKIRLFAIPKDVPSGNEESILTEIIDDYTNNLQVRHSTNRDNLAASFSCKSAIKTGAKLGYEQMKQLVIDLMNCKMPYICPHGRPVILELTLSDLDKQFGRT
ncbi:MAG: DNA mismatch repair endonuclease MutL [Chloroherpetonaceae bacterium]